MNVQATGNTGYRQMGIINITDNSFVPDSRMLGASEEKVVAQVRDRFERGADIVDIGACSTAPGNALVTAQEEWQRLRQPLKAIFSAFPDKVFSIDTFRADVAEKCLLLAEGLLDNVTDSLIINDISAGEEDPDMLPFIAESGLQYIAMDRTDNPLAYFEMFAHKAERLGIHRWILDPGFGFGKTVERNWEILRSLPGFKIFGREILVAVSRKRMIHIPAGLTSSTCAKESMEAEDLAVSLGADIIRTHDLRPLPLFAIH